MTWPLTIFMKPAGCCWLSNYKYICKTQCLHPYRQSRRWAPPPSVVLLWLWTPACSGCTCRQKYFTQYSPAFAYSKQSDEHLSLLSLRLPAFADFFSSFAALNREFEKITRSFMLFLSRPVPSIPEFFLPRKQNLFLPITLVPHLQLAARHHKERLQKKSYGNVTKS